ncbi:MauE/DoxX family redox-associated membrane protein [Lacipirellula sp.]|uniref:MauE/DoxX family redox-associated membrane protein n=1 Tax=Lacipirellula sp. TaxID=2691419 RepID=UPI003D10AB55
MPELIASDTVSPLSDLRLPHELRSVWFVRMLIGGLLLATAALKIGAPAESAKVAAVYGIPPLLSAAAVQVELAFAALLIFGCWPRQTLFAAAALFALFGAFSAYRGLAGYESCGCFGAFQVNPWITAALDAGMVCLAAWGGWRSPGGARQELKPLWIAGGAYAVLGFSAAAVVAFGGASSPAGPAFLEGDGIVILDPESWVGKPFPLASYLGPAIPLQEGRWTILIHHHDCPHCQEAAPQYERLAETATDRRVVLIETPPYGESDSVEGAALRSRLSDSREWFVQTPVEIEVDAGIVTGASAMLPAIATQRP